MNWIHCNKCHAYDGKQDFFISNCGHLICSGCLPPLVDRSDRHCPICNELASFVQLKQDMPDEIQRVINPIHEIIQETIQVSKFQSTNYESMVQFLKDKLSHYKSMMEKLKNVAMELKENNTRLNEENASLRHQLQQSPRSIHSSTGLPSRNISTPNAPSRLSMNPLKNITPKSATYSQSTYTQPHSHIEQSNRSMKTASQDSYTLHQSFRSMPSTSHGVDTSHYGEKNPYHPFRNRNGLPSTSQGYASLGRNATTPGFGNEDRFGSYHENRSEDVFGNTFRQNTGMNKRASSMRHSWSRQ